MAGEVKKESSSKSLTVIEPAKSLEEFRNERKAFRNLVKSDLKEGTDFGLIPGTKRKSLWQPGAEKLASFFGLTSNFKLIKEIERLEPDPTHTTSFVYYRYRCTLAHFETGKVVGQAERSCNSKEAAKANTRKSVYDLINTCQALAQKRAFVAAVRTVTMASDFFVADISNGDTGPTTAAKDPVRTNQIAKLHAVANPRGFNEEKLHKAIFVVYKARSITDLTGFQIDEFTERLTQEFKVVGIGNEPVKHQPKGEAKKPASDVQEGEVVTEEEEPKKPKMCAQCVTKPAKTSGKFKGFCSKNCQDKYYPPKKTLKEKMETRNDLRGMENKDLKELTLQSGVKVWFDPKSKEKCECGAEIWWAITDKNKKPIPVELVGLSEWDTHFATCPLADKKRKKKGGE